MSGENVNTKTVRENLLKIMKDMGKTTTGLASYVGIDSSNFIKKMKGTLPITTRDFTKFANAKINTDFLLTGEGMMYVAPINKSDSAVIKKTSVPVFEEEFACGFTEFNDSSLRPIGYVELPGTRGATCWCKATGHSMEPSIDNGDYVCLRKMEDFNNFIVYGDIYAVDAMNDMRTIKKIERGEKDDEYMLVPANDSYQSQPIRKDMIRSLFRVVAVTKLL